MATVNRKFRSKQAYIKSTEILAKINDGTLDQYDIVYCSDTRQACYIDGKKVPHFVNYKFDIYADEASANIAINNLDYTYVGQIVMVETEEDGLKPYIVNINEDDEFYVIAASAGHSSAIIDYNSAENTPIKNIVADTEIILADLDDGYYSLIGSYRMSNDDPTHRMTSSRILFNISHGIDGNRHRITYILELKADRIKLYSATYDGLVEDRYVLNSEFNDKVIDVIDDNVDQNISNYVDTNAATDADINNLFSI